ncbi:MAG: ankyrin repeat domain-containing protein [Candidatus Aminicenantes bacterium]|jgi:ankyrin repeat protein
MKTQIGFFSFLTLTVLICSWALTEDIHKAAKTGDVLQLKKILENNPDLVNSTDRDKMTPLHHAIDEGKLEAASFLISSGAKIDPTNYKKETPLHIAAYEGNAEAVRLLLKHGADLAKREMRDRIPLFLACNWGRNLETVRLLIDAGSDVNDKNSRGEIVLVSTLYYGKKEIIDLLIDRGATLPNDEETLRRVLYITASNGMERPFNMAVEKCIQQEIDWWTGIPMHACARGGSVDIAKALIAKGADFKEKNVYGVEALHIAAENGRRELIEFLLSKGADIDSLSVTGKTALHYAQENGHDKLATWLVSKGASEAVPKFPVLRGEYLGQEKPGDTPRMFAPGIVSGHGFDSEHSPAVFSPDGKEVYWTKKFRGPILYMKQVKGVWTAPQPAPFCSEYGDGEPIFFPDGSKLYFLSFRPIQPGGSTDKENMWVTERGPGGWSAPKPVSPLINACDLHWLFSVANNGNIYFASPREGGFGANDIYRSRLVNGEYQEPENLGEVINTSGVDHTPFIAPDESYLIFVSRGRSASSRDFQFYISYKKKHDSWEEPIAVNEMLTSIGSGLCPAVTPDGKYMFFIGRGDIYWVDAAFIEKLRPNM